VSGHGVAGPPASAPGDRGAGVPHFKAAFQSTSRAAYALLALGLSVALVLLQFLRQQDPHVRYDRFQLPSYDSYVYVAMAERPGVFTVAPWGYRLLTPVVVHALPLRNAVLGLRLVSLAALSLTGLVLYLFLRRLGHSRIASLAAIIVFGASPPVAAALHHGLLADALPVLLLATCLLTVEAGWGIPLLIVLITWGTLGKEFFPAVLPFVGLASWPRLGVRRAFGATLVAAVPVVVVSWILQSWWVPQASGAASVPGIDQVPAAIALTLRSWRLWWQPVLLGGVAPLALVGALRAHARPYLARYGYMVLLFGALPFVSAVYTGDAQIGIYLAADIPRLLLYALPLALPLAVMAFEAPRPQPPPLAKRRWPSILALATLVATVAGLLLGLDHYRRIDLRGTRDGPLLLALSRETQRVAERIEHGATVTLSPETHRFSWGATDPPLLGRMRWFLRSGFGMRAHYSLDRVVMQGAEAELLLPCARPRPWRLRLTLRAPNVETVAVQVNGRPLGVAAVTDQPTAVFLDVPASVLFRGDNLLALRRHSSQPPGPELLELAISADEEQARLASHETQ
jgi:hypothetical protein